MLIKLLKDFFVETIHSAQNNKFRNKLEIEYLFSFSKLMNQIDSLCKGYNHIQEIKTLRIIFNQLISNTTLPFWGEPLKGLQVMGMLETRTLDFENIILLSANEGMLPSGKSFNSFIPYDIRKEFNLPTYKDRDAVYAYHFYRLLQRASNIFLVYNTQNDDFGKGERSRFIYQIIQELPN